MMLQIAAVPDGPADKKRQAAAAKAATKSSFRPWRSSKAQAQAKTTPTYRPFPSPPKIKPESDAIERRERPKTSTEPKNAPVRPSNLPPLTIPHRKSPEPITVSQLSPPHQAPSASGEPDPFSTEKIAVVTDQARNARRLSNMSFVDSFDFQHPCLLPPGSSFALTDPREAPTPVWRPSTASGVSASSTTSGQGRQQQHGRSVSDQSPWTPRMTDQDEDRFPKPSVSRYASTNSRPPRDPVTSPFFSSASRRVHRSSSRPQLSTEHQQQQRDMEVRIKLDAEAQAGRRPMQHQRSKSSSNLSAHVLNKPVPPLPLETAGLFTSRAVPSPVSASSSMVSSATATPTAQSPRVAHTISFVRRVDNNRNKTVNYFLVRDTSQDRRETVRRTTTSSVRELMGIIDAYSSTESESDSMSGSEFCDDATLGDKELEAARGRVEIVRVVDVRLDDDEYYDYRDRDGDRTPTVALPAVKGVEEMDQRGWTTSVKKTATDPTVKQTPTTTTKLPIKAVRNYSRNQIRAVSPVKGLVVSEEGEGEEDRMERLELVKRGLRKVSADEYEGEIRELRRREVEVQMRAAAQRAEAGQGGSWWI